jgi:hypothetical protein
MQKQTMTDLKPNSKRPKSARLSNEQESALIERVSSAAAYKPSSCLPIVRDIDIREADHERNYLAPVGLLQAPGTSKNDDAPRPAPPQGDPQVSFIEALFDEFVFSAEKLKLNNVDDLELASVYLPRYTTEINEYNIKEKMRSCKGYLSTRLWSLLIQGYSDRLEIFLVPSEKLLRFMSGNDTTSGIEPLMVVTSTVLDAQLVWLVKDEIVSLKSVPRFARKLFGYLFLIASGEVCQPQNTKDSTSDAFEHKFSTLALAFVLLNEEKITWDTCRALENILATDIDYIGKSKFPENAFGCKLGSVQSEELSNDLRSLKEHITSTLNKYCVPK